ncbi:MAG: hypothetical protein RBS36_10865 [Thiomicrospira sp.]|jgi:heme/copper-type cytochrome/quinol oxidase subunit 2|nr:hypothetical protein [Thiomicrospira sp.]
MWIEHIGTIALVAFIVLVVIKLGIMFMFKLEKRRKQAAKDAAQQTD